MDMDARCSRRLFAAGLVLALAGCGGGDSLPLIKRGSWRLGTAIGGETLPEAIVAGADVPSAGEVESTFTVEAVAALEAGRFPGKATSASGSTLRVTDPETDLTVDVESVGLRSYEGCGSCSVGSVVAFDITVVQSESGLLDGMPPAQARYKTILQVRYQRIS